MNRTALVMSGLAFAVGACASSTKEPATAEEYDDTAQAIGETLAAEGDRGDVVSMKDAVKLARGIMPFGFFQTSDRHFGCRRSNLDVSFTIVCKDAAGAVQAKCNSRTDEAAIDVAWSGSVDTRTFDSMVSRLGSWTLTGLQSETATFSGLSAFSSSTTLTSVFSNRVSSYELNTAAAYNAIHISTDDRETIDGSASFDVSAHRVVTGGKHDVDRTFEVHTDVIFHPDHTATLILDGEREYLLDLDTGRITRVPD